MKTILVPTDFSKQAKYALDFASVIAKKAGAKIKLVHVLELPSSSAINISGQVTADDPMDKVFTFQLIESSKKRMAALAAEVEGVEVETHIHPGSTFQVINNEINAGDVDLLVMGTTGSSGVDEIMVGSNAEKVVRYATCPVITLKTPVKHEIKHIVFASDFGTDQPELVNEIKKLQEFFGATLHIVKINTPHDFHPSRKDMVQMEGFINRYGITNCTKNIYNDMLEEEGIMYYAFEVGADMIAMATRGRTGLSHIFSGSIAEDVVNHAKKPVWTFRLKK